MSEASVHGVVHLRAAGVSLLLSIEDGRLPVVSHWGGDLGALGASELDDVLRANAAPNASNGVDRPLPVALLPEAWTGWTGSPGLAGHRSGSSWSPRLTVVALRASVGAGSVTAGDVGPLETCAGRRAGGLVLVEARDDEAGLAVRLDVELTEQGVLRARATVTNLLAESYVVDDVLLALPLPPVATEVLDLAGRWATERIPQRHPFGVGMLLREGRHGRTGADATLVLVAGTQGFGFRGGQVWGLHVAWSGNHRTFAERAFTGERLLGGGELLLPGEVELGMDESYRTPWLYGSYGDGMDDLAHRFHAFLRARPTHPSTLRPVTFNVWEAVYFDHDPERLHALAELSAKVGVERFVLDDGWFHGRRHDRTGLGDWFVDAEVWPDGLSGLADHVHGLGMQFGLWFEPEMVNPDSELFRAHPDWALQVPGRLPVTARHQQVLDVANPETAAYLRERIVSIVRECGVDYIKWDHNRDLVDAGTSRTGRASVHEQTLAIYALLDEIRATCPGLEIESCSSGGARVDLEILQRTDRVWASDCIDAHERQRIQRWTAQLLPPELVGAHIGAARAHTTGRTQDLSFRAATAVFGHLGIEWDLTAAGEDELEELAAWIAFGKQVRTLVHTGTTVRADLDGEVWLHGVVSPSRDEALYAVVMLGRPVTWPPGRLVLPGLDPHRLYDVSSAGPAADAVHDPRVYPAWWATGVRMTGAALLAAGLQMPALNPDQAALVHVKDVAP
ncbi:alpha-galactosidase [Cellulomonas sp. URHE0023]|uniref:alpha-galactosidase n=1 Tax=Cellulomonas sp. URHE0023 TaxID=1380354 RepID=UPI000489C717|nr:alpha-galactosidase [Cellulomonas sp. URHE0023]